MKEKYKVVNKLVLGEISLVDRPAQKPAIAVIEKRETKMVELNKEEKAFYDGLSDDDKKNFMDMTHEDRAKKMGMKDKEYMVMKQELDMLRRLVALSSESKKYYDSLDEVAQKAFIALDATAQKAEIAKSQDENAVVYKSLNGDEYRRSDGERIIKMVKELDELKKAANEEKVTKRAENELAHLPGTLDTHIAIVKALDTILDENTRDRAFTVLKSHNVSMNSVTKELGTTGESSNGSVDDPNAELKKMAKNYADENKVAMSDAIAVIWRENPALAEKAGVI